MTRWYVISGGDSVEEARELVATHGQLAGELVAYPDPCGRRVYVCSEVGCGCGDPGCPPRPRAA